jgi:hypothetical protein
MRGLLSVCLIASAFVITIDASAQACQGTTVLVDERFDSFGSTWGEPTADVYTEAGRLTIKLPAATINWAINQTSPQYDIDACVNTTWTEGADPNKTWSGLVFWYKDAQNFYVHGVSPLGTTAVWRLHRNRWLQQVQWVDTKEVRTGVGAFNSLRVVTKGKIATLYVNDVEIRQLKGHPPPSGQILGLLAENLSDAGGPLMVHTFDDFRVTQPR